MNTYTCSHIHTQIHIYMGILCSQTSLGQVVQPRMTLNFRSSCHYLPIARILGVCRLGVIHRVLGVELRTLFKIGKHSINWGTFPVFFCFFNPHKKVDIKSWAHNIKNVKNFLLPGKWKADLTAGLHLSFGSSSPKAHVSLIPTR